RFHFEPDDGRIEREATEHHSSKCARRAAWQWRRCCGGRRLSRQRGSGLHHRSDAPCERRDGNDLSDLTKVAEALAQLVRASRNRDKDVLPPRRKLPRRTARLFVQDSSGAAQGPGFPKSQSK